MSTTVVDELEPKTIPIIQQQIQQKTIAPIIAPIELPPTTTTLELPPTTTVFILTGFNYSLIYCP